MHIIKLFCAAALLGACASPQTPMVKLSNKAIAVEAITQTVVKRSPDAVDAYFGPQYIQHNPMVPNGTDGLKDFIASLQGNDNFSAEIVRVIADGDHVAFHGRYNGLGPKPMVSFDVFRLENGRIVEHWDNLIEVQPPNPSGRTQLDGATEITDLDKTEANKAKVLEFINKSLIMHENVDITQYISPVNYIQHNSTVADGLDGFDAFMKSIAKKGITMDYTKVHKVIGEGNFVLTMSEGSFGGQPQAFYDLFRLEHGLIVEHWDVIAPMPGPDAPHNEAGKF